MLFKPFDTNNVTHQETLGLSPPIKKCDKSPSKVPQNADLLFREYELDDNKSGFKLDLQSITVKNTGQLVSPIASPSPGTTADSSWQSELRDQIAVFEQSFA